MNQSQYQLLTGKYGTLGDLTKKRQKKISAFQRDLRDNIRREREKRALAATSAESSVSDGVKIPHLAYGYSMPELAALLGVSVCKAHEFAKVKLICENGRWNPSK